MLDVKRCAVYTRKSTPHGLELEFNSLQSQAESCMSYIDTRKAEGWVHGETYEEGVRSGGSIDRPVLQKLLADVRAGKIQVILVYKLDRFSRSLIDFLNMMEELKKYGCSLVSITQSFDTSTEMGQLIMNILLSFAQFERQVASARVKDKVYASRKKGYWMGGSVPYGYRSVDKRLVIEPAEAEKIRWIFETFAADPSTHHIVNMLREQGLKTARGNPFSISVVANILKNPIYIGKIPLGDDFFPGKHEAIISQCLWERVRTAFLRRPVKGKRIRPEARIRELSTLGGLVRCSHCSCAMPPTYTNKKDKHYCYYVCSSHQKYLTPCPVRRVPAAQLENLVFAEVENILQSEAMFKTVMNKEHEDFHFEKKEAEWCFETMAETWSCLFTSEKNRILELLVGEVRVYKDRLSIFIRREGLMSLLREFAEGAAGNTVFEADDFYEIQVPLQVVRAPKGCVVLMPRNREANAAPSRGFEHLPRLVAMAWKWGKWFDSGKYKTLHEIAKVEGLAYDYAKRVSRLNQLAPDIIEAIMCEHGFPVSFRDLSRMEIPFLWSEQREKLLKPAENMAEISHS